MRTFYLLVAVLLYSQYEKSEANMFCIRNSTNCPEIEEWRDELRNFTNDVWLGSFPAFPGDLIFNNQTLQEYGLITRNIDIKLKNAELENFTITLNATLWPQDEHSSSLPPVITTKPTVIISSTGGDDNGKMTTVAVSHADSSNKANTIWTLSPDATTMAATSTGAMSSDQTSASVAASTTGANSGMLGLGLGIGASLLILILVAVVLFIVCRRTRKNKESLGVAETTVEGNNSTFKSLPADGTLGVVPPHVQASPRMKYKALSERSTSSESFPVQISEGGKYRQLSERSACSEPRVRPTVPVEPPPGQPEIEDEEVFTSIPEESEPVAPILIQPGKEKLPEYSNYNTDEVDASKLPPPPLELLEAPLYDNLGGRDPPKSISDGAICNGQSMSAVKNSKSDSDTLSKKSEMVFINPSFNNDETSSNYNPESEENTNNSNYYTLQSHRPKKHIKPRVSIPRSQSFKPPVSPKPQWLSRPAVSGDGSNGCEPSMEVGRPVWQLVDQYEQNSMSLPRKWHPRDQQAIPRSKTFDQPNKGKNGYHDNSEGVLPLSHSHPLTLDAYNDLPANGFYGSTWDRDGTENGNYDNILYATLPKHGYEETTTAF
ncbi:uncharacterized protein LOC106152036 [Lingula anatina]|uniref:Uncharacterized protein LOC106152036 n=1 Tax=Lingula anatina TaxID=7574 RepID=A0A1S3H4Q6_LINAN|nr:uncharacterized protein LOC106152036 [Lingula anatina]|eukprot:XP_013380952.1 uncharacterized protein LOC106152036 [Lingula anatina]